MRYLFVSLKVIGGKPIEFFPLGLAYVAAAFRNTGRYVSCINLNWHKEPLDALLQKIKYDEINDLCI